MKAPHRDRVARFASLGAILILTTSCLSDKVVYKNQPAFSTPPTAAASFVGYSETDTKQTVCGNCHIDLQTSWLQTGHAKAWAALTAATSNTAACQDCHTVSGNGNGTAGVVAYSATKDPRYQDVQCENCHGPGLTHVTSPTIGDRPLASIAVDTGTKFGCAGCHTGTHEPFVQEWSQSAHATFWQPALSHGGACLNCHTAQGTLAAWGVTTNYKEANSTTPQPVVCVVCHEPHGTTNPAELRYALNVPDIQNQLCMKCHQYEAVPDTSSSRNSVMSPEGPTLLGTAGYFPPNMPNPSQGGAIVATHGSASNPKLCATCHVARFTVTDPKTNNFVFQATGHLFVAAPCLNAQGIPTAGDCPSSQRSYAACATSGCHGAPTDALNAYTADTAVVNGLIRQANSQLAKVPKSAFVWPGSYNSAKGLQFNVALASKPGAVVHNAPLIEQLLANTIKQVQSDYGVAPQYPGAVAAVLQKYAH